jgi:hypothetical protein
MFPDETPKTEITSYFGIPIDKFEATINQVHKVNAVEKSAENTHVHPQVHNQVHKVNAVVNTAETASDVRVHFVNSEVNGCSSSILNKTTTTGTEFTDSLIYPEFKTSNELNICKMHIVKLEPEHQQSILDELAARMNNTTLPNLDNPIGYLKGWLIKQLESNEIPWTSPGMQLTATREGRVKVPVKATNTHQQKQALTSELNHLQRMIEFEERQGNDTPELIAQRDRLIEQLNESEIKNVN